MNKTFYKTSRIFAVCALSFLLLAPLALLPVTAQAASGTGAASNIGFYVRAIIPENQIDETLTYFDLRMTPGKTQQLKVEVVNETNEEIQVNVVAISASTNRNGIIDYRTPNIRDKTLQIPFSEISTIEQPTLTIPANGVVEAVVQVAMPDESYDGAVLGSIVFTRDNTSAQNPEANGITLNNVFSYVVGVKLTENDTIVLPDFEIESISAQSVNFQPVAMHNIRNTQAVIVKNLNIDITILDDAGNLQAEVNKTGIDMAPNSILPLAITMGDGSLNAGDYVSDIRLEHEGKTWEFQTKFTIGSTEAQSLNSQTPQATPASAITPLVLLIGGAFLLLIIVIFLLIFLLFRRRKKEEQENNQSTHSST